MSELNLLKKELFGNPDSSICDIKFYPGYNRDTTPEEAAKTIRASLKALKEGRFTKISLGK